MSIPQTRCEIRNDGVISLQRSRLSIVIFKPRDRNELACEFTVELNGHIYKKVNAHICKYDTVLSQY